MRRIALLLVPTLLAGCGTIVGNPADGAGGFLGNVFSFRSNPNRPVVDSPNARRVMGAVDQPEPLETEPGNVWPGPLPPARTMSDMQREMGSLPPIDAPRGGSASPPPVVTLPAPRPLATPPQGNQPPGQPAAAAAPGGRVLQTPGGPAVTTIGGNGVETFTLPSGRTGIVMPNANGTLTLIGPDGTTQTIPAPR
jgi:hypothetical protein